jgi:hypothetical protein
MVALMHNCLFTSFLLLFICDYLFLICCLLSLFWKNRRLTDHLGVYVHLSLHLCIPLIFSHFLHSPCHIKGTSQISSSQNLLFILTVYTYLLLVHITLWYFFFLPLVLFCRVVIIWKYLPPLTLYIQDILVPSSLSVFFLLWLFYSSSFILMSQPILGRHVYPWQFG